MFLSSDPNLLKLDGIRFLNLLKESSYAVIETPGLCMLLSFFQREQQLNFFNEESVERHRHTLLSQMQG